MDNGEPDHAVAEAGKFESGPITSAQYHQAMVMTGSAFHHSVIGVQNISANALVGSDVWGTYDPEGRSNRFQPIQVSAKISMRDAFDSAAQSDRLNDSTVHYGNLSKAIQKVLLSRGTSRKDLQKWAGIENDWSLYDLLNWIFVYLTGFSMEGGAPDALMARDYIQGGCPCLEKGQGAAPPLLNPELLQELEFRVNLPKATLLSSGVSLTATRGFPFGLTRSDSAPYRSVLHIHNIRIPTLIGVNSNERLAKQIVIASVQIDPYISGGCDWYNELEQIVAKSLEESSYETLESLATHLSKRIIKHFIFQYTPRQHLSRVKIILEKPTATTFADYPIVEVDRCSDPTIDKIASALWDEWKDSKDHPRIPYPLGGRLDTWINQNFPGDSTGA